MTTVPLLEAERLTVRRAGRTVLDDVSMAVAGGDMVAQYGPPGPASRRCSRCSPASSRRTGARSASRAATGWLEELGLSGRAEHRAEELSGGEQRVALARALAGGAGLLLVDEPTAELDEANRDRALALLRAAADRGTAVVVATHDPAVVACCDRMLRLTDGRVPAPADPLRATVRERCV
jgi:ABC-type multidrug transport system ATPase subunit